MRRTIALALLWCGCLQGVPDNINCIGDETCPTDYYCSDNSLCVALADGTPPKLVFNGVGTDPGSANGTHLVVPVSGITYYLSMSNTGTHDANGVSVGVDGPPCADLHSPAEKYSVPAGGSLVVSGTSNNPLASCAGGDVGVTLDTPQGSDLQPFHRVTSATFRVDVQP